MIVLRIEARGESATVRTESDAASIGAGPQAQIARDDVGWAAHEGVLERVGERLRLSAADGTVRFELEAGGHAPLGDAVLTFVAHEATVTVTAGAHGTTSKPRRRRSTFDDELYAALRRAPWYAVSIAVHVVLVGAFLLLGPGARSALAPRPAYGLVEVTRAPDDPWESGGPESSVAKDPPPEEAAAPDPEPLETEREPMPDLPPEADVPAPRADPVGGMPPPDPIGPERGVIGLRRGVVRPPEPPPEPQAVPTPTPIPPRPAVTEPTVDEEYATETNRKAAARIKDAMRDATGALGKVLRGARSQDLLVVSNGRAFDHLEYVLEAVSIPYVRVSVAEFAAQGDLSRTRVLLWNCGPPIDDAATRALVARKIAVFVHAGGFLWTTDWGLRDVVATAFPGRLATSEDRLHTLPELMVDVRPPPGSEADPLLEGVLPAGPCRWWLEAAAAEVRVLDTKGVRVLLEAPLLAGASYRRSPVIAATFAAGKGRVLHVMGHAWQEKADVDGTVGMQRLALNFVRARLERDLAAEAPR